MGRRGGMGVGMAFLYPSLMANVVNRVGDDERASALSSFTMFFEIGTIVGGVALGAVGEIFTKRAGFLGGAVDRAGRLGGAVAARGRGAVRARVAERSGVEERRPSRTRDAAPRALTGTPRSAG